MTCKKTNSVSIKKFPRKNTKQKQRNHQPNPTQPPKKLEAGLGAMEERASSAGQSHPQCSLCRDREKKKICRQLTLNYQMKSPCYV